MRIRRHVTLEEVSELNLVPYMDIMVNLIIFLLFTMTSFVQMKIINVSVPAIGESQDQGEGTPPPEQRLAIVLGIIHKQGFLISLNGKFMEGTPEGEPTIKCLPNGNYDFDTLQKKMMEVKRMAPAVTAVTIVPDKAVDYETLVKTMDAIRRDTDGGILYPDVLLGVQ